MSKKPKNPSDDDEDYQVGYGRPPVSSRFEKGQSGNPKGRPKGSLNVATRLKRALSQKVPVRINGVVRNVTYLEAFIQKGLQDGLRRPKALSDTITTLIKTGHLRPGELIDEPRPLLSRATIKIVSSPWRPDGTKTFNEAELRYPLPDELRPTAEDDEKEG